MMLLHMPEQTIAEACPHCGFVGNAADATVCEHCQEPLWPASADHNALAEGTLLKGGEYTVERPLGSGQFAITYRGHSFTWDMPVAIKELFLSDGHACRRDPQGARVVPGGSHGYLFAEYKTRFREEARQLFQIHHPHTVKLFDLFEENNTIYMVMEWVEGPTLEAYLAEQGTLPLDEALPLVSALAEALGWAHDHDVYHRDICPRNILLRNRKGRSEPVLIDFALARETVAKTLRSTGLVFAEGYAPPELLSTTLPLGPFTDLYSLAAVLYSLLTGVAPPSVADRAAGLEMSFPDSIPAPIRRAIFLSLEPKAAQRPQDAQAFLQALGTVASNAMELELQQLREHFKQVDAARRQAEARLQELDALTRNPLGAEFRDHGDGTVTDNRTGLQWMRCGLGQEWNGETCTGRPEKFTWDEALEAARLLNRCRGGYARHHDWRLPSKGELLTLVDMENRPAINLRAFPTCPGEWFWSASPYNGNNSNAWGVNFLNGHDVWYNKSLPSHVRLVRGGL